MSGGFHSYFYFGYIFHNGFNLLIKIGGGAFGYFPSYALGSAYGAQMLRRMEQDVDVWGAAAKGDLTPITAWLREKVHQYGGLMEPADVVKNACGDFSAEDYIQYLTRKYTGLYGL